jgi:hypothetical protein
MIWIKALAAKFGFIRTAEPKIGGNASQITPLNLIWR